MSVTARFRHVVVGGGVVGLAAAHRLANLGPTLLIEKNSFLGEDCSSRNSEVIHAGIYYPPKSLKTKLCIAGRKSMYSFCAKNLIGHRKIGKWIFGQTFESEGYLQGLKERCDDLKVPVSFLSKRQIEQGEPLLRASVAVESPETGVVDAGGFMRYLEFQIEERGGLVAKNCELVGVSKTNASTYVLETSGLNATTIETDIIVNAGGLYSDKVARLIMGDASTYALKYLKGYYCAYNGKPLVSRLTYPVPDAHLKSLGIHTTLDLSGRMKLGPDAAAWVDSPSDYALIPSDAHLDTFYNTVKEYLPSIDRSKLTLDYAGIRPKLAGPGEPFRDFIIEHEAAKGFPGVVNLVGIESPGLTSSLAIARYVCDLLGFKTNEEHDVDG